jgi:hypothetical protein
VYKGEDIFECKDCLIKWKKIEDFKLKKNPDLLMRILEEDNKRKIPNVSILTYSLERRRK